MTKQYVAFSEHYADYKIFPENMKQKDKDLIEKLDIDENVRISTGENIKRIK